MKIGSIFKKRGQQLRATQKGEKDETRKKENMVKE